MNFLDPKTLALLSAGSGLLSAAGPSRTPVSFGQAAGQGLQAGLLGYQQGTQIQHQGMASQLQEANLKREQAVQEAWDRMYGGGSQSPNPMVPGPGASVMAGSGETIPQQAPQTASRGPTLDQIGALGGMDPQRGKFALEHWKALNPELKYEGGVPFNPRTGQPISGLPAVPKTNQQGFSTFLTLNPQTGRFEVNLTPGGREAYGAQQEITERAKARFQPFMGVTDAQNRPIPMTAEQFSGVYGGAKSQESGQSQVPQAEVSGFSPTEADALARVRESAKQGRTATFTVDPAKAGGMGQSPAQQAAGRTIAEGDAKRVLDLEQKIPSLLSVGRRLDRMAVLTKDDKTYAAAGSKLKTDLGSIAQAFGLNVNQSKTANTEEYMAHVAELLKDRLASKDYGSGTGVSNLDILSAQKPLPELAKTAQGRLQIIDALKEDTQRNLQYAQSVRDYFDANQQTLRGFRLPSELAADRPPLPKTPGTPPMRLPQGVKVRRIN